MSAKKFDNNTKYLHYIRNVLNITKKILKHYILQLQLYRITKQQLLL